MAESAEFILRLNDQVSGAAKNAAAALRAIDDKATAAARKMGLAQIAADKMNRALDSASAGNAAKALADRAHGADKAAAAIRKMGLAQLQANKMNAAMDAKKAGGGGFFGSFTKALPFRSVSDYAGGAFLGELAAKGVESIVGGFIAGAKAAVGLVADGVKMAFVEGGKAENLRLSYKLLLGDKGGKDALADISGFAGKTKYDDDDIATMMRPLFNAGLKGTGARSAFAASGDLEAAGLGPAQEFIDQFAKIELKGGVTEKLLVGMGVNIKDFKAALANETGTIDKEAAFKKATEGKSDPQAIMNAIFRGIEKRQGGQLGTGTEAASKTMSARLEKLSNLPSQYLKKMSESPEWQKLSDVFGDALVALDPDSARGQQIVGRLFDMFKDLATWIREALTPDNLTAFVNGVHDGLLAVQSIAVFVKGIVDSILFVSDTLKTIGSFGGSSTGDSAVDAQGSYLSSLKDDLASGKKHGVSNWYGGTSYEDESDPFKQAQYAQEYQRQRGAVGVAAANGNVRNSSVNVATLNITTPPGADGKETAAAFYKRMDELQHKSLESAAAHGGG